MKIAASSNSGLLSVWWYDGESFIGPEDLLDSDSVTAYGRYLQLPYDHYTVWSQEYESTYNEEYDYFPRGRIVFDSLLHKYKVIGDAKIVEDEYMQQKLCKHYGLSQMLTIFEADEHYQSEYRMC